MTGKTIAHREVPDDVFAKLVPRGGEELVEMLRYFQEFGCEQQTRYVVSIVLITPGRLRRQGHCAVADAPQGARALVRGVCESYKLGVDPCLI